MGFTHVIDDMHIRMLKLILSTCPYKSYVQTQSNAFQNDFVMPAALLQWARKRNRKTICQLQFQETSIPIHDLKVTVIITTSKCAIPCMSKSLGFRWRRGRAFTSHEQIRTHKSVFHRVSRVYLDFCLIFVKHGVFAPNARFWFVLAYLKSWPHHTHNKVDPAPMWWGSCNRERGQLASECYGDFRYTRSFHLHGTGYQEAIQVEPNCTWTQLKMCLTASDRYHHTVPEVHRMQRSDVVFFKCILDPNTTHSSAV